MKRTLLYAAVVAAMLPAWGIVAYAEDPVPIYGSQLMTQQERNEFRDRMHAAKTEQEREQIRKEHHEKMQLRAKEKGVALPDEPPAPGRGMRPGGGGMGPGMGGGRRY